MRNLFLIQTHMPLSDEHPQKPIRIMKINKSSLSILKNNKLSILLLIKSKKENMNIEYLNNY